MPIPISYAPSQTRRSVLTVFCSGEPWREIHTSIFGFKPELPKNVPSQVEFEEIFNALEYRQVKAYALRRLSKQAMPSKMLTRALKERLVFEQTIAKIIEEFTELGFLNDKEWSSSFVRVQSSKKMGPRAIAQKLAAKGIKGEALEEALEGSWEPDHQKSLLLNLLNTRYANRNFSDFKEKNKVVAALMRKGFELPIILEVIEERIYQFAPRSK